METVIKGRTPRMRVFRPVETYQNTMGVLIKAVVLREQGHAFSVKKALMHAEDYIYKTTRDLLFRDFEANRDDSVEGKTRFNDSVSRLKFLHINSLYRIRGLKYVPS